MDKTNTVSFGLLRQAGGQDFYGVDVKLFDPAQDRTVQMFHGITVPSDASLEVLKEVVAGALTDIVSVLSPRREPQPAQPVPAAAAETSVFMRIGYRGTAECTFLIGSADRHIAIPHPKAPTDAHKMCLRWKEVTEIPPWALTSAHGLSEVTSRIRGIYDVENPDTEDDIEDEMPRADLMTMLSFISRRLVSLREDNTSTEKERSVLRDVVLAINRLDPEQRKGKFAKSPSR